MEKRGLTGFLKSMLTGINRGLGSILSWPINPSTYPVGTPFGNDFWIFNPNGEERYFNFTGSGSALKAYNECPPFSAIIEQKAQAYINGTTYVLNTQGREANSEIAKKIKRLFTQPNPVQSGDHFEAQVYINTYLFGYTVILPLKPFGFPLWDSSSMWAVPGNMVEIQESKQVFFQEGARLIENVKITYKGQITNISPDNVIIIRDFRPSFNSIVLPESRTKSLENPINNIIGALLSRHTLIRQRGPRYLVSSAQKDQIGTTPLLEHEKQDLLDQFARQYGLMPGQSSAIISNNNLTVTPIGFDVKQLGLFEEVQESSSMLCIGLGFPKFLAGLSDPTFNNQETAEKALYNRFIIPDSRNFYGQWNAAFKTEENNLRLEKDYSTLTTLQQDKEREANARLKRNQAMVIELERDLMTINRFLELNGEDTVNGGDVYWSEWKRQRGIETPSTSATGNNNENTNDNPNNNGNGKAHIREIGFIKSFLQ